MLAVERTTRLFIASVKDALPDPGISVSRSKNSHGRSNYVHLATGGWRQTKVRISDHPVGVRRALSGEEHLFISAGAKPSAWAVWLGELCRQQKRRSAA